MKKTLNIVMLVCIVGIIGVSGESDMGKITFACAVRRVMLFSAVIGICFYLKTKLTFKKEVKVICLNNKNVA